MIKKTIYTFLIPGLILSAISPVVTAQDVTEQAKLQAEQRKQELNLLTQQIQGVRQRRLAMERSNKAEAAGIKTDILRLQEHTRQLDAAVKKEKNTHETLVDQAQKVDQDIQENRDAIAGLARASAAVARRADQSLRSGIPYTRAARREKIAALKTALSDPDPLVQARGVTDLAAFFGDEFTLASSTGFFNAPVMLNNERKVNAYQVRLGLVQQFFVAENRQLCGVFAPGQKQTWDTDLSATERSNLIRALDILRKRKPPELTPVPWLMMPAGKPAGGPHATE